MLLQLLLTLPRLPLSLITSGRCSDGRHFRQWKRRAVCRQRVSPFKELATIALGMQAQHGLLLGAANGNLTGQGAGGGAGQDQGALDGAVAANGDQAQGSYHNLLH